MVVSKIASHKNYGVCRFIKKKTNFLLPSSLAGVRNDTMVKLKQSNNCNN